MSSGRAGERSSPANCGGVLITTLALGLIFFASICYDPASQ